MITVTELLETRWMTFASSLEANMKAADTAFIELVNAYGAPTRKYHSLSHIKACLDVMDRWVPRDKDTPLIELALWFHDIVYVPGRKTNEEESAFLLQKHGRAMGLPEKIVGEAMDMIPYTKHNANLKGMATRYLHLLDVDLSILGEDPDTFDEYEAGVRFEYAFVPEEVFRSVRARILQSFLDRQWIYETETFQRVYETQARDNLVRSIQNLTSIPSAGGVSNA